MVKACIFDFDGILADTEELHYLSFQVVLKPLDAGFSWDHYVSEYIAFDSSQVFAAALKTAGITNLPYSIRDLIDQKIIAFADLLPTAHIPPLPGAIEAVRFAHQHGPIALCTGAERKDVTPLLNSFCIIDLFQAIVTADDVRISKPDPECYALAASLLNTAPEDCLAIEDTPGGLRAARGAGCQTLGVTTTHSEKQLHPYADRVVDSLLGFSDLLG
ncbi:MAG: HAD-IA family hydrolase [Kiritimatiellae bacterium]|jgi:beta-phosphoglucomutase|nr:HAD-IA family hydrolase [Kiritimatiellia bacterium]